MEDFESLFGLFIVAMAVISAVGKNKKKKAAMKKTVNKPMPQARSTPSAMETLRKAFEEAADDTPKPAKTNLEETMRAWFEQPKQEAPATQAPAPAAPAAVEGLPLTAAPKPVVQPRVTTRVAVKEQPAVILGSLGEDTHEGIHPCDEHADEPLGSTQPIVARPVEKPGIQLDWTGDNMVKAFIMQEVLSRPSQRRRA